MGDKEQHCEEVSYPSCHWKNWETMKPGRKQWEKTLTWHQGVPQNQGGLQQYQWTVLFLSLPHWALWSLKKKVALRGMLPGLGSDLRLPTILTFNIQVNARPVRQKLLQFHSVSKATHLVIKNFIEGVVFVDQSLICARWLNLAEFTLQLIEGRPCDNLWENSTWIFDILLLEPKAKVQGVLIAQF